MAYFIKLKHCYVYSSRFVIWFCLLVELAACILFSIFQKISMVWLTENHLSFMYYTEYTHILDASNNWQTVFTYFSGHVFGYSMSV